MSYNDVDNDNSINFSQKFNLINIKSQISCLEKKIKKEYMIMKGT